MSSICHRMMPTDDAQALYNLQKQMTAHFTLLEYPTLFPLFLHIFPQLQG